MSSPDTLLLFSIVYQHLLVLAMAHCNIFILFARRSRLNRRETKSQSQPFSPLNSKKIKYLRPEEHVIRLPLIPEGLETAHSVLPSPHKLSAQIHHHLL